MTGARLKHYGWGREGEGMSAEEREFLLGRYRAKFSRDNFDSIAVPRLEDISLRARRITLRWSLPPFDAGVGADRERRSPVADVVDEAVRARAFATRTRGERVLRRMGVHVVARDRPSAAPPDVAPPRAAERPS